MSHPGQAILAALPFNKHVGLSVDSVSDGAGVVSLPDRAEIHNHIGTPHAGALYTAAEAASGAAILGSFADKLDVLTPLALNARIEYLKVARGTIVATATAKKSKADALAEFATAEKGVNVEVEVSLKDAAGIEVTKATFTWYLRKNR
jgi:acyl-coenzyme A thioesterase PaaI-like protein